MKKLTETAALIKGSPSFKGNIKFNENLSSHTTMHTGGPASLFIEAENEGSLVFTVKCLLENKIPFFLLGGGSNTVIRDEGLAAVVSTRKLRGVSFSKDEGESKGIKKIKVMAGSSWGSVISFCKKNNLGGLESFTGLSGTVGGALYMNASCFGLSACDNLVSCDYLDLSDLKIHTYKKNDSDWGYKRSPFQFYKTGDFKGQSPLGEGEAEDAGGGWSAGEAYPAKIIISAEFSVEEGFDSKKSGECMAFRKEKGHFKAPSCGSAFKNDHSKGIIAGKIIDECGLKGLKAGGAEVAMYHANFIINPDQKASAKDIKKLSEIIQERVYAQKGIKLESEIIFV